VNRLQLAKYLDPAPPTELIYGRQTTGDIIHQITVKHKRSTADYDKISAFFAGGSTAQVCKRIWDFCKKNLRYYEEAEESQYVSSPQTILARGYSDCKGYALFVAGILDSLRRCGYHYLWEYRFVSYQVYSKVPGHVFVVVKDGKGNEIWVDPVLSVFNDHRRYAWELNKHVRTGRQQQAIGCSCDQGAVGAMTTVETGQMISKFAPALSAIPVVGVFAAAGGEVLGLALQLFGRGFHTQDTVRGLTQLFAFYVKGENVTTRTVNENETNDSYAWFYAVLGVPITDRRRFDDLKGTVMYTTNSTGQTHEQRAQQYLNEPDISKLGIPFTDALAATYITDTMPYNGQLKAWAQMLVNPKVADLINAGISQAPSTANPGGVQLTPAQLAAEQQIQQQQAPGAAGGIDTTSLALFGGIGLVAFSLLSKKKK
jgi:hypothetical protein